MKLLVTSILFALSLKFCSSVVVRTQNGLVEGRIRVSDLGREYFSFMGIPYGRPTVGALKFRDPQPALPWTNILNCTGEGSQFWNFNGFQQRVVGSFDSLHVNVFTKNINPVVPYPVMVYIHGGGYHLGSGSRELHGPDFLLEKDVLVVTFNYRLGVYGFLSLNDSSLNIPGNAALKDQRLALRWIQQNIANFGGDPNRVTLFGFSSGGGSTHYHMLSESSRGLFHRGISMGGNGLHNIGRIFPSGNWAQLLAQKLGFRGNPSSDRQIFEFLDNADPVRVTMETLSLVPPEALVNGTAVAFGPTLEPYETEGIFIKANVFDLVENAWSNDIPFLIGQTSMEILTGVPGLQADPELFKAYTNFEIYIPLELGIERNTEKSKKYAKMIKDVYYPVFPPTRTNIDALMFCFTDNDLWFPTQLIARYRLRAGNKAPTFIYRFDADTDYNFVRLTTPELKLYRYPSHGMDMFHIFKSIVHQPFDQVSEETKKTVDLMTTAFTNFAATGNPSIPELGINWPAVSSESVIMTGLDIHEKKTKAGVLPEARRMKVFAEIWDAEFARN